MQIDSIESGFNDGLAICALMHKLDPSLVDFPSLSAENACENLKLGFKLAEDHLGTSNVRE